MERLQVEDLERVLERSQVALDEIQLLLDVLFEERHGMPILSRVLRRRLTVLRADLKACQETLGL